MDTQDILIESRARFQHQESKLYLQEKYKNRLIFAWGGGLWNITPGLLAYLRNTTETAVIADEYGNPIKINAPEFFQIADTRYRQVMEEWLEEYTALCRNR